MWWNQTVKKHMKLQLIKLGFSIATSFCVTLVSLIFQHVEKFLSCVRGGFMISVLGPDPKCIYLKNLVLMSEEQF
jgi:hypothetical protein